MGHLSSNLTLSVCAKNAEKTIEKCLESIKQQSVKPDDVYIVLDNKNDSTGFITKKYGFKIIISEGRALYNQRNAAFKKCKTKYLTFTDADCILDKDWIKNVLRIFEGHPEVVAGTGKMPSLERHNFTSWVQYMFYPIEPSESGYTRQLIGGNSYFRTEILKELGGWSNIIASNAEDVEISRKIIRKGYKMWFDTDIIAYHNYRSYFKDLIRCSVNMGYGITKMVRNRKEKDFLFYYIMMIPVVTIISIIAIFTLNISTIIILFGGTLIYWVVKLKSINKAFPHWIARWILALPYSLGIIKAILR